METQVTGLGCSTSMDAKHPSTVSFACLPADMPDSSFARPRSTARSRRSTARSTGSQTTNLGTAWAVGFLPSLKCSFTCNFSGSQYTTGTGPSTFDHFREELKTQFQDLTWQKRPPK
ncbi:hypothetical protein IAQ61_010400 [Plenodomus lingam]|uniref:uncharacterized protein n=1 Tax=Leptosphaeria maculans TaxID=5022 RepID=UPI00331E92FB|nr:hypothetical protein IAQ61_010400 [Plenodomus lingam]